MVIIPSSTALASSIWVLIWLAGKRRICCTPGVICSCSRIAVRRCAVGSLGAGVVAIVHDQVTLDRIQGVIRELQLDDELSFEATLDAGMRRIHEGQHPRVLVIDLSESQAPIAELSAARAVGAWNEVHKKYYDAI